MADYFPRSIFSQALGATGLEGNNLAIAIRALEPVATVADKLSADGVLAGTGISVTTGVGTATVAIDTTTEAERIRDTIGTALTAGTGITLTVSDPGDTITVAIDTAAEAERARDTIGTALTAGTGITITPNDGADTITVASTITQYTDENARDALGTALTAGTGITVTPNDGADTITIATTITQYTDENARDALGTALVAGSGTTITVNDGADTITVAADAEYIRDTIGTALVAGTGTTVTVNDAGDTITIAATGTGAFSGALVHKLNDQTTANYSAGAMVAWDSEASGYDTDSYHDTVTNNTRITIGTTGKYVFAANITITSGTITGGEYARMMLNKAGSAGTMVAGGFLVIIELDPQPNMSLNGRSAVIDCTAADYFELWLDTEADTSITVNAAGSWFSVQRVA